MQAFAARPGAQEQRLNVRRKMLPGTWVISELRKAIAEPDAQVLRDLLGRHLSEMALRDDRILLEKLLNGRTTDETG